MNSAINKINENPLFNLKINSLKFHRRWLYLRDLVQLNYCFLKESIGMYQSFLILITLPNSQTFIFLLALISNNYLTKF